MERDSDGNLVNAGNFDSDGVNVNRWNPDNANDNLGVLLSRSVDNRKCKHTPYYTGVCLLFWRDRIHPPSMRPISFSSSSNLI